MGHELVNALPPVVFTAAGFLVLAALIDEIGPVRATVITYVNPAVAAVLGVRRSQAPDACHPVMGINTTIAGALQ